MGTELLPHPSQGWHPRGHGATSRSQSRGTRLLHCTPTPWGLRRARLGYSSCSSSSSCSSQPPGPRSSGSGHPVIGTIIINTSVTAQPAPLWGHEPPTLHTSPSPFSELQHTGWGCCQRWGRGRVEGAHPTLSHCQRGQQPSSSLLPAFPRQLRREGALQPLKCLCEPARPCPIPARHRRCKAWVSQPLLPAPELLQSCSSHTVRHGKRRATGAAPAALLTAGSHLCSPPWHQGTARPRPMP